MLRRLELALLIGILISVALSSLGAFAAQSAQLREEVLRLHVVANSDDAADQAIKLVVRDAVLAARPDVFVSGQTKAEATSAICLPEIEQIAKDAIMDNGYFYPVSAELVNMYFSTRQYEDFTLPAGRYDAIRLIIGQGAGENWWCVMFPPMCIPAAQPGEQHYLEDKIARLGQSPSYRPKFAVVELIENLREALMAG